MDSLEIIEQVKRRAIIAMFSDDLLMERLVLKGGNALQIAYGITTRASFDLDFSMSGDFESLDLLNEILQRVLPESFLEAGWLAFDIRVSKRPPQLTDDLKDFWGGYLVDFKVVGMEKARGHEHDVDWLRKHAFAVGPKQSTKYTIDISCHERCDVFKTVLIDDYAIKTYTLELILCEKLRAICQQHPAYGPVVKRDRPGSPRPRDFVDIHSIRLHQQIDVESPDFCQLLKSVFEMKKVPLSILPLIGETREFHRREFPAVLSTVSASTQMREFDFYFDEVLALCSKLQPGGNE